MQKRVVQGTSWKGRYYENEMRFSMERESKEEGAWHAKRKLTSDLKGCHNGWMHVPVKVPGTGQKMKMKTRTVKGERRRSGKEKGDRRKFDRLHLDSCQASWRARNVCNVSCGTSWQHKCSCLALATSHSRQLLKTEKSFFKSFFCQLNLLQYSELSSTLSCANFNRARQQRLILDSTLAPPPYLTFGPLSLWHSFYAFFGGWYLWFFLRFSFVFFFWHCYIAITFTCNTAINTHPPHPFKRMQTASYRAT